MTLLSDRACFWLAPGPAVAAALAAGRPVVAPESTRRPQPGRHTALFKHNTQVGARLAVAPAQAGSKQ
ncbi:MAG: hypothetical protein JWP65_1059 [Ramlibacter sp.]|uniref:hypothetical protein n=1 Tax=Ramlibacter sp. TaxID=1917967 RepID=UPI00262EFACE|nr:hypothetical protein [Ramlibacter sp.]MDB5750638.1 hypothetical protein [Ramlibacter sp.]